MASRGNVAKRPNGKWRARYRDDDGREYSRHFALKKDANDWLVEQTGAVKNGTHVKPGDAKTTVAQLCDVWLASYHPGAEASRKQAEVDLRRIRDGLGSRQLRTLRPMHVEAWLRELRQTGKGGKPLAQSSVYATYRRFAQITKWAVRNGYLGSVERVLPEKAPKAGEARDYVATKDQIEALAAAFPAHLELAVWLGAYAGLRNGELCGLRLVDVNPLLGTVTPVEQHGGRPLKTKGSANPIGIAGWLSKKVEAHVAAGYAGKETLFRNEWGDPIAPWVLQRAMRSARRKVPGLPAGFRIHDTRHYFGSRLIDKGESLTVVQNQMRHASASTTLRVYAHAFEDATDRGRAALEDEFPIADEA